MAKPRLLAPPTSNRVNPTLMGGPGAVVATPPPAAPDGLGDNGAPAEGERTTPLSRPVAPSPAVTVASPTPPDDGDPASSRLRAGASARTAGLPASSSAGMAQGRTRPVR